jgi:alcohol dehydrogenase (cytochrome c)
MMPQPLTDLEIWETHAYVRQLMLAARGPRDNDRTSRFTINVDPAAILAASDRSGDWLTYGGNYEGHRHSRLTQISRTNVGQLRMAWAAQLHLAGRPLQASPIVTGGLLFVSMPGGSVVAIDARTGREIWRYQRPVPSSVQLCCGSSNRGVAILQNLVYVATLDAHLVALDASTGKLRWIVKVADFHEGYSMAAAPLATGDRVVVGVSGGDFGARGFVAAFAASDGRLLWKFHTVPKPGDFGHSTWAGDSWKSGGGATWVTGAYDKKFDSIYWGVANAAPIYQAQARIGDNLFTMSVVSLELSTGRLRWYFQFSPGDDHDWDSAQQPIVADIVIRGKAVPALLWANRNGFFYALDRRTGAFLYARAFVKQTWAQGFDSSGRPIQNPAARPSPSGSLVWPWDGGATNWLPPSYDPARGLVYVPTSDAGGVYFSDRARRERGRVFNAGTSEHPPNQESTASVKAIEAATGNVRWEVLLEQGLDVHLQVGGILSTDGGLVFVGYRDEFIACDSDTGAVLWRLRLGGTISAAPIAYAIDGQEFIAIAAGETLFTFALRSGQP